MKRYFLIFMLLGLAMVVWPALTCQAQAVEWEYVTSTVSLIPADVIEVQVVNDSDENQNVEVVLYHDTGAGAPC